MNTGACFGNRRRYSGSDHPDISKSAQMIGYWAYLIIASTISGYLHL